jgi:hypothetical protein
VLAYLVDLSSLDASLIHSFTHSFSAHILKADAVARGRRREAHAQSYFILVVLVLVLALYWQSIIEEVC